MSKVVIGWREWIEFPEWQICMRAKIDTGAKTSSIDVTDLKREGDQVSFTLRLSKRARRYASSDFAHQQGIHGEEQQRCLSGARFYHNSDYYGRRPQRD